MRDQDERLEVEGARWIGFIGVGFDLRVCHGSCVDGVSKLHDSLDGFTLVLVLYRAPETGHWWLQTLAFLSNSGKNLAKSPDSGRITQKVRKARMVSQFSRK
jgi:hypothetical protein